MAEINYIEINAENRSITIPQSEKLLGVENDSKAIRKYFRCPKIVGDGIDLTKSDVHINIQNASNKVSGKDRYNAENLKVSGENVTFEWSPLRKATSHKGTVRFSVCVTEEGTDREASDGAGIKLCYQRDVNLVVKNLEDAIASMTTT